MGSVIFNRKYQIFFSVPLIPEVFYEGGWRPTKSTWTPDTILEYIEEKKKDPSGDTVIRYKTLNETYTFTDLNIEFKITKSVATTSNKCELIIYNADQDLLNRLDSYQGKGIACEIRVGRGFDQGTMPLVFQGVVSEAISKRIDNTVKTKIKLTDGGKNFKETYSKRSYKSGISVDSIVSDLIKDLSLPVGFVQKLIDRKTNGPAILKQAKSFSGSTYQSLQRICTNYRADFSVQNGFVYICDRNKRIPMYENTPILSDSSGVIEELRLKDTNSGALHNDVESNRSRYSIKTIMFPDIVPHTTVFVPDSEGKNIPYKVEEVKHEGEYEGQKWYSTFELSIADPVGG